MSKKLKVALVGLGNIGKTHVNYLPKMNTVELVAVCDVVKEKAEQYAAICGTAAFTDFREMFDHAKPEAVIIAVPHYDHPTIAIEAFERGIHVLCEKPISVHVNDAARMIEAHEQAKLTYPKLTFGLMFQERTYPHYRKIKDILDGGELGRLTRVTWINTTMFRSQTYYDSGDWRATWAGEGGGILVNQCPHTLDMYQWLFGVPVKISAHAHIGKYHDIEVEDEVTAYFEHENGMVGHLIVTTAESPGTNRFEIVGENGKLVYEDGKLMFYRNRSSMLSFIKETKNSFGRVENWPTNIPVSSDTNGAHPIVAEKFVNAILQETGDLIAHGREGINSVIIANGIMLSSFKQAVLAVPFDADEYEAKLQELIQTSKYVKKTAANSQGQEDMSASFGR
ncbi:Gfo/Idh/MocA family protein [Paenibacillus cremeus]|uniref:Gfo/Idh/MocA family oxidoreductase n=1 Tax=Paenibacillus cremeus TaxID=2163881 RepID=A0A559KDK7_9BACL|nr:Gfo/Idh/MocA family oxidoreductase [Paenibacillus cremeus]TVY10210.1 Gfo/Idh/MocA family oxidoreductase [Paenibacillus cremeus]